MVASETRRSAHQLTACCRLRAAGRGAPSQPASSSGVAGSGARSEWRIVRMERCGGGRFGNPDTLPGIAIVEESCALPIGV